MTIGNYILRKYLIHVPAQHYLIGFLEGYCHHCYAPLWLFKKKVVSLVHPPPADLVDLRHASEVFRAEIVGGRKVLYEADKDRRHWFEMRAFRDYALLNERRQPILDNIRERGSIYD